MEHVSDRNKNFVEEIKKDKFPGDFANVLNASAFVLIVSVLIVFFVLIFSSREKDIINKSYNKIEFKLSNNIKLDSVKLNAIVDSKLKGFKEDIINNEKERNENMKYYGTLVGFIFSIVGFFGFKSIHDTRQMALDAVKVKAEEVAKKITSEKIQGYVNETVKDKIDEYFDSSGKQYVTKVVEQIAYKEANIIAKNTALEEFNNLKTDLNESSLAFKDDLESIERDRKRLLKRIQDLEKKIYGDPTPEDDENGGESDGMENESGKVQPVV